MLEMTDADYALSKQLAELVISVLSGLSGGQGYAGVSLFDAGTGGGFQSGTITIFLERDGLTFEKKFFSEIELVETLALALEHNGGLPYRRALRKFIEWSEQEGE